MTLVSLLDMIGRELGIRGAQRPCLRSLDDLPPSLQEFYAQYDGLTLPFLELCPAEEVDRSARPGWCCFGFDGYFSYCLANASGIDLWDHEAGLAPEAAYDTVAEMIAAVYRQKVVESDEQGAVVVLAMEDAASVAKAIAVLKRIDLRPSPDLLRALRSLPVVIPCARRDGIGVVRELQALGFVCHLSLYAGDLASNCLDLPPALKRPDIGATMVTPNCRRG